MSRVAVIGEEARVRGFALAGALVLAAEDAAEARAAWRSLPPDVAVAVLSSRAAGWLRDVTDGGAADAPPHGLPRRPGVLPVVMPPEAGTPEEAEAGETPPAGMSARKMPAGGTP
jgi:vacuolar-type H+-ATPase subunit F/Vma7